MTLITEQSSDEEALPQSLDSENPTTLYSLPSEKMKDLDLKFLNNIF